MSDMPSEDYVRAHGTEYKQRDMTHSGRWYVLNGVAYHSRCPGHMELSQHKPGTEVWNLHLVAVNAR